MDRFRVVAEVGAKVETEGPRPLALRAPAPIEVPHESRALVFDADAFVGTVESVARLRGTPRRRFPLVQAKLPCGLRPIYNQTGSRNGLGLSTFNAGKNR